MAMADDLEEHPRAPEYVAELREVALTAASEDELAQACERVSAR